MNSGLEKTNHTSFMYYDSDYPSTIFPGYQENLDGILETQGLKYDLEKYAELAKKAGGDVLELCCGTGRVALALLSTGFNVTAVDFCEEFLIQFKKKLGEMPELPGKTNIVLQDVTNLDLDNKDHGLTIMAFNSLLCITDFESQLLALKKASEHMVKGGILALDLMNPLNLNFKGDPQAVPFFTRRNPYNGNTYTRFAAVGPMSEKQVQKLYGWYDETDKTGNLKRNYYEMHWRPVFRYEIELMLEKTGFKLTNIYGGHRNEKFEPSSKKMFIEAIKI